jgi:hypothetical protein
LKDGVSLKNLEEYLESGREDTGSGYATVQITQNLESAYTETTISSDREFIDFASQHAKDFSSVHERARRELVRLFYDFTLSILQSGNYDVQKESFMSFDDIKKDITPDYIDLWKKVLDAESTPSIDENNLSGAEYAEVHQIYDVVNGIVDTSSAGLSPDVFKLIEYLKSVNGETKMETMQLLRTLRDRVYNGKKIKVKTKDGDSKETYRQSLRISLNDLFMQMDTFYNDHMYKDDNKVFLNQLYPDKEESEATGSKMGASVQTPPETSLSHRITECINGVRGGSDIPRGLFIALAVFFNAKIKEAYPKTARIRRITLATLNDQLRKCGWPPIDINNTWQYDEDEFALLMLEKEKMIDEKYNGNEEEYSKDVRKYLRDAFELTMGDNRMMYSNEACLEKVLIPQAKRKGDKSS